MHETPNESTKRPVVTKISPLCSYRNDVTKMSLTKLLVTKRSSPIIIHPTNCVNTEFIWISHNDTTFFKCGFGCSKWMGPGAQEGLWCRLFFAWLSGWSRSRCNIEFTSLLGGSMFNFKDWILWTCWGIISFNKWFKISYNFNLLEDEFASTPALSPALPATNDEESWECVLTSRILRLL